MKSRALTTIMDETRKSTTVRPAIIVMVKAPRAGEAKTRLVPPLAYADAASLAACFARDVLVATQKTNVDVIVAYTPPSGRAHLVSLLPASLTENLIWIEQPETPDLGARLTFVADDAFARGYSPLVMIGTDSPTLPVAYITSAINILQQQIADITLGPTADGGYYLVGLRHSAPEIFARIEWSTPHTYEQTRARIVRLNLRLHELPPWYDVDDFADLKRLREELMKSEEAPRRAPATAEWLDRNDF